MNSLSERAPRACRVLRGGGVASEQDRLVALTISTRVPEKWLAVDMETGEVYRGDSAGRWNRADSDSRASLGGLAGNHRDE